MAYAVSASKCDVSMMPTFDQGVSAEGVTFSQCAPSSCVRQMNPSSVPAQTSRSAVRDGETGLVVPPTDADAITEAIRSLLLNPERRQQMGRAARHAIETHYNWDRVARDTRDFTYEVVKRIDQ